MTRKTKQTKFTERPAKIHERETLFSLHLAERLCEEASKA
jgi:hypothetical protein